MVMQQLETYGIINGTGAMTMHQLYAEFAVWHVTSKGTLPEADLLVEDRKGHCTRIRMVDRSHGIPRECLKKKWKYLLLLQLHSCRNITELHLEGLYSLRHLELIDLTKLKALTLHLESYNLRFLWLSGLDSLQRLPDFRSCCMDLQVMLITRCFNIREPLRLDESSKLQSLHVDTSVYQGMGTHMATSLRSLMKLEIVKGRRGRNDVLNLEGLGLCDNLEWLILKDLPVKAILGLPQLTSLGRFGGRLIFYNCDNLEDAPEGVSEIFSVYRITLPDYVFTSASVGEWDKERGSDISLG